MQPAPELVATFDELLPRPPAGPRHVFGHPAAFVNGNLFMGLFQDRLILRLPDAERPKLMAAGARPFEPMAGRPMREYVELSSALLDDRRRLRAWTALAFAYGKSLPPKAPKPKRKAAAGKPKKSARGAAKKK